MRLFCLFVCFRKRKRRLTPVNATQLTEHRMFVISVSRALVFLTSPQECIALIFHTRWERFTITRRTHTHTHTHAGTQARIRSISLAQSISLNLSSPRQGIADAEMNFSHPPLTENSALLRLIRFQLELGQNTDLGLNTCFSGCQEFLPF